MLHMHNHHSNFVFHYVLQKMGRGPAAGQGGGRWFAVIVLMWP